jgi:hypothetical protein
MSNSPTNAYWQSLFPEDAELIGRMREGILKIDPLNITAKLNQPRKNYGRCVLLPTNDTISQEVANIVLKFPTCKGKERAVEALISSGRTITEEICHQLPSIEQVRDMYGPGPIVYGLETCQAYRDLLQSEGLKQGLSLQPMPKVAGLHNSGTNLLAATMHLNFGELSFPIEYAAQAAYEVPVCIADHIRNVLMSLVSLSLV